MSVRWHLGHFFIWTCYRLSVDGFRFYLAHVENTYSYLIHAFWYLGIFFLNILIFLLDGGSWGLFVFHKYLLVIDRVMFKVLTKHPRCERARRVQRNFYRFLRINDFRLLWISIKLVFAPARASSGMTLALTKRRSHVRPLRCTPVL